MQTKPLTKTAEKRKESTVFIESLRDVIHSTAKKDFTVGYASVKAGEEFHLVRSGTDHDRFYVVAFMNYAWSCSCGAQSKKHAHVNVIHEYTRERALSARATSKPLPRAARIVTDNLTSGHPTDTGTMGSLSSNRQPISTSAIVNRNISSTERSIPSFMKR